ncbi:hypothetical protein BOSEA31B_12531 [Hyphomicrobiales bacterium]|nr:hypothetical protein BOSEA31B_12531 [Hyphomicrobiales bacterium]
MATRIAAPSRAAPQEPTSAQANSQRSEMPRRSSGCWRESADWIGGSIPRSTSKAAASGASGSTGCANSGWAFMSSGLLLAECSAYRSSRNRDGEAPPQRRCPERVLTKARQDHARAGSRNQSVQPCTISCANRLRLFWEAVHDRTLGLATNTRASATRVGFRTRWAADMRYAGTIRRSLAS